MRRSQPRPLVEVRAVEVFIDVDAVILRPAITPDVLMEMATVPWKAAVPAPEPRTR